MADKPRVKHQSKMDAETFLKHMNGRHTPAAGITHFGKSNVPGDADENLLRAMHDTLHQYDTYKDTHHQQHTHGEADE